MTDNPTDGRRGGQAGGEGADDTTIRGNGARDNGGQVRIVIPDEQPMVSLLGSGDELLRVIENAMNADFHVRGNEITITGPVAETAVASRLFDELIQLASSGAELTTDAVEHSISMLRRKTGARPAEVLNLDILSSRGRTIRPKKLNQKRYMDAIDNHTIVLTISPAGTAPGQGSQPDHPYPARRRGRGTARIPAGHPVREDRPVPAAALRRVARHGRPGLNPPADCGRHDRDRPAGIHARTHLE